MSIELSKFRHPLIHRFFAGIEFAAKVLEFGLEYDKEAYEKTEKHTGRVYEAGKGKSQELQSCQEEIRSIN